MMYEELTKALRNCTNPDKCCEDCGFFDKCYKSKEHFSIEEQAADAIEKLDTIAQTYVETVHEIEDKRKWIPVTERLPECDLGAEVGNIEWISCGMVHAGCFGRGGKYRDAYFRTWTDDTEGIDAKDADYWRPIQIPQPPKDGEP